jgi:hypothetical protein
MNVYMNGAICHADNGAPLMIYLTLQKPLSKTRHVRISLGTPGLHLFDSALEQALDRDVQSEGDGVLLMWRLKDYNAAALLKLAQSAIHEQKLVGDDRW